MFILLSVAVFFGTVNKFYTKVYLKDVDSFSMLFITNSILSFILLPVVLYNFGSLKSIPVGGWLFILFACSAWSVAGYLGNKTYEVSAVSIREPLSQLQIIFAVLIGILFFQESLMSIDFIGIGLIIFAGLILSFVKKQNTYEITLPVFLLILLYTLVSAGVSAMDKISLKYIEPHLYMFFTFFLANVVLLFFFTKEKIDKMKAVVSDKEKMWLMIKLSFMFIASYYTALLCYKYFDFSVAYPILKLTAPLTAFTGMVLLNEKNGWKIKVLAVLLAFLGAVFIKVL